MADCSVSGTPPDNDAEIVVFARNTQPLFGFTRFALTIPHCGVKSAISQQFGMRAALGDTAILENDYFVGGDNRRKAVRDDDRRPVPTDEFK
jgi:hypothetical protein